VRSVFYLGIITGFALAMPGCGSSNEVWVTCEIQRYGKPYSVPENHSLQVTFYAMKVTDQNGKTTPSSEPYPAASTGDGKFEVPGPAGRGIPPGKYRVSVIQTPKNTATAPKPKSKREAADRDFDFLRDKFSPESSPIVRTIDGKTTQLAIDLDSPAG
jgi:hypothetical protein